jgi:hypothetical protein
MLIGGGVFLDSLDLAMNETFRRYKDLKNCFSRYVICRRLTVNPYNSVVDVWLEDFAWTSIEQNCN